ncbi:MAG TPA: antibiotic biosynthesis monooxygenase family protein [Polyangiales bacterium]|nr:antibiotic biosynthesis monooxygenase family protein [Polyangiales bacterium]
MNINVVVTFKVQASKIDAFRELMDSVKTHLPTVSGCDGVRIMQSVEDPRLFTLVERWDSKEKHRTHIAMLVASGQWERIREYLAAEPLSHYAAEL